ncbi:glucosyltransferase domain-containing protein [Aneurinibacillus terranovensis]|uniref:glucosyltransferase domain-containing protein n=1 Tax=Aneurinibacillus terranovensis TaxID=278991 RepID=UPI00042744B0|nr:glucosyltransferase domain-containing protein [Aneurinibacillus terranovensis]
MKKTERQPISFLFWIVFAVAIGLKYGYANFHYYPVLDDWLQYGAYQLYENPIQIFLHYSYHTRPLASLFDVTLWGKFWPDLTIPFVIITILHIASCYLLYRTFSKVNRSIGIPAAIILGLMPLGNEATYWLSASSRLVVGMFFMLLSLYLLAASLEKRKKALYLGGFWFFQLVSFAFYEQIIAMGFVCSLLIMLWKRKQIRWQAYMIPILNLLVIGGYYVLFKAGGNAAERGHTVKGNEFWGHIGYVFHQFYDISVWTHSFYYRNSLPKGLMLLLGSKSYVYLVAIVVVSFVCGWFAWHTSRKTAGMQKPLWKIIAGILLAVLPLAPFFLITDTGLALRNVFPSMIGLALLFDGIFDWLGQTAVTRLLYGIITGTLTFAFIVPGVTDIVEYKKVSEADRYVAEQIVAVGKQEHKLNGNIPAYLFGAESYLVPESAPFLNHIKNVTDSEWALTGAVRAAGRNRNFQMITPVSAQYDYIVPEKHLNKGLLLGIEKNLKVIPLQAVKKENGDYRLLRHDGSTFGVYYVKAQHFKWK